VISAAAGEEPHVTVVEDATLVVVEETKRGTATLIPVTEVRDRRDQNPARREHGAALLQHRGAEVLEHIRREHHVERAFSVEIWWTSLAEVSPDEAINAIADRGGSSGLPPLP
jgi:hypothetical protein